MKKNRLTFGDLKDGEKFILFPTSGKGADHNGFADTYVVYIKMKVIKEAGNENAAELSTFLPRRFHESVEVVRVEYEKK